MGTTKSKPSTSTKKGGAEKKPSSRKKVTAATAGKKTGTTRRTAASGKGAATKRTATSGKAGAATKRTAPSGKAGAAAKGTTASGRNNGSRRGERPVENAEAAAGTPRPGGPERIRPEEPQVPTQPITIEIDRQLERLDEVLEKVREEVGYWAKKGVYTKVRFKFRGKPLLPDMPMAAFVAAEAATFWWGGLLRALAVNLGGRALFDVELISDAEPHLARGKEHLLDGDVDDALDEFYRAAAIDRNLPAAHLNIGIAHKVKGEKDKALRALQRARDLDPHGDVGGQAQAQIRKILGD